MYQAIDSKSMKQKLTELKEEKEKTFIIINFKILSIRQKILRT